MTNESQDQFAGLFEHEKAAIREELRVFMRQHPARAPLLLRFLDGFEAVVFNPRFQFATATLGLILITGSGTAFAAQNALPGDPLYGIKVNIEEPLMGAFATSPEAKANWNAQLAAIRLSEAERLAAQNKLTPAAASAIAGGLNQAAEGFDANVAELATSTQNAATVAALASTMEATLAANTQVMNEIASAVPEAAPALQPILSSVQERTLSLNTARASMDMAAAQADTQQAQSAAQSALTVAVSQVTEAASNAQHAPVASTSPAGIQVAQAQQELDSGRQNFNQGNYIAALENLQAATVNAHAAQLNLSISAQLGESAGIEIPDATTSDAYTAASQGTSTSENSTVGFSTSSTQRSREEQKLQIHL
ncbi:MAG: DUF5667 domain-containing protein [Candidatus Pacebacteria bacterium]|nr:DUF5667 domain-containing protein [Candidatus Paceibacterota bacterium]